MAARSGYGVVIDSFWFSLFGGRSEANGKKHYNWNLSQVKGFCCGFLWMPVSSVDRLWVLWINLWI